VTDQITQLIGVFILVFLNGFFVAAEFALVKVREYRIRKLAQENKFGAKIALHLLGDLNSYLSASQLGITMTSLGLGWLAEKALADLFIPLFGVLSSGHALAFAHAVSATLIFIAITFLHIVVGEQAPKIFAIQKPEPIALLIAWPLRAFHFLIYPGIWVLNNASLGLLKLLGLEAGNDHEKAHSAEELQALLKHSSQTKQLTSVGGSLLLNALDLRRRKARQVMVHRTKIIYLSTTKSIEQNLRIARESTHSRFPLCQGTIDQIIGMIYLKDLLWLVQDNGKNANIASIKRDIIFVPETMPLERLLNTFLTQRIHLAVLVDEYGTIVGMVTLENVMEEIVGDIQEESDRESLMFQKLSEKSFKVHGELPVHDLEEPLGIHLNPEDVTTIGGYIIQEIGHFPQKGESLRIDPWLFTVARTRGHQITQIDVTKVDSTPVGVE
jgi:CBS domain containing-hemolysin-like protein